MIHFLYVLLVLQLLGGVKTNAYPSESSICKNKGKIQSIIIGGIRAPGHWLYSQVDKIYEKEDEHVLIINDLSMTNPDVLAKVNNEALPILNKNLACLKGSVNQILFEHVGYGLQEKHFDHIIPFLISLLEGGGKIVYISYRVPFSYSYSQVRQRQKYIPIVPSFCQLLGIPEPHIAYEFYPYKLTLKGRRLQSALKLLNEQMHQKITALLKDDSCCDVENDPEILELMKKAKIILNHPHFPSPVKPWSPIESYLPLHDKILNCNSDLPHGIASCNIIKEWWSFRTKKNPCSQTLSLFEDAGFVVQSIEAERTDDVFAFKIIVQKPSSQTQLH